MYSTKPCGLLVPWLRMYKLTVISFTFCIYRKKDKLLKQAVTQTYSFSQLSCLLYPQNLWMWLILSKMTLNASAWLPPMREAVQNTVPWFNYYVYLTCDC